MIKKLENVYKLISSSEDVSSKMTKNQSKALDNALSETRLLKQTIDKVRETGSISIDELSQLVTDSSTIINNRNESI